MRSHRGTRQSSRPQSANNPFRHYEHVRRPWYLRRNAPQNTSNNNENSDVDLDIRDLVSRGDRTARGSNTSEYLQKMIVRLAYLVRQQRALARNNNINRRLDGSRQPETTRDNDDRQMEEIREATRLRARYEEYVCL